MVRRISEVKEKAGLKKVRIRKWKLTEEEAVETPTPVYGKRTKEPTMSVPETTARTSAESLLLPLVE